MGILKLQKPIILALGLYFVSLPALAYNPADDRVKEECSTISLRGFTLSTNYVGNNMPLIFSTNESKEICMSRHNKHWTVTFYGYTDGNRLQRWDGKPLNQKYCLNAYKPKRGSIVNLYRCDASDSEQTWETFYYQNKTQIRKIGTDLCLNSYRTSEGSQLNLWTCDKNDADQLFDVVKTFTLGGT